MNVSSQSKIYKKTQRENRKNIERLAQTAATQRLLSLSREGKGCLFFPFLSFIQSIQSPKPTTMERGVVYSSLVSPRTGKTSRARRKRYVLCVALVRILGMRRLAEDLGPAMPIRAAQLPAQGQLTTCNNFVNHTHTRNGRVGGVFGETAMARNLVAHCWKLSTVGPRRKKRCDTGW
eukprot:TRINITY_DN3900_c0_g1_i3.p1 TRINITY_DN3900_c0_g1~~TRINITY_DN3900_c0_g1_i3.p1  ORF type:complete len:177 (-),score=8.15 TRINITY_DN3900_c0_g1_i3:369-899(-)